MTCDHPITARVETEWLTCKNLQVSCERWLTCKNLQASCERWLTCKNLRVELLTSVQTDKHIKKGIYD